MAEPRARVFEYQADFDGGVRVTAKDESQDLPEAWEPEHLLLAALVDCSLTSLRYHAKREGIEVSAAGSAAGTITKRDDDGRFAFVDIEVRLDATLSPPPADAAALLAKAERDCFIGASLTTKPRYVWSLS